jgi:hypothetical protein
MNTQFVKVLVVQGGSRVGLNNMGSNNRVMNNTDSNNTMNNRAMNNMDSNNMMDKVVVDMNTAKDTMEGIGQNSIENDKTFERKKCDGYILFD